MKKLIFALGITFAIATSYISSDKSFVTANNNHHNADTLAAPVKFPTAAADSKVLSEAENVYSKINFSNLNTLKYEVFEKALKGFENLKKSGKVAAESKLLTICDFSLSSNAKRLWIIDVESGKILFNSLVAHGKNTGEEFATKFSNTESSLQSSLGFYVTDVT